MKLIKSLFIIFFYFSSSISFSNDKITILENKIFKNLRCLICQGQSVYDSQSEFAESMKLVVRQKLEEGLSEKEIYDFLKNQYGEWILYDPEFNKNTYFLWILPIIMFLIGGVLVFKSFIIKKN